MSYIEQQTESIRKGQVNSVNLGLAMFGWKVSVLQVVTLLSVAGRNLSFEKKLS